MQSTILKLQAEVAARKQNRSELWPNVRMFLLVTVLFGCAYELGARSVDTTAGWVARAASRDMIYDLGSKVDALQGKVDIQGAQLERLERVHKFSSRYGIGADLALAIDEIARAEGIDPALAFQLVWVESRFNPRAVSPVGAVGLTQLMPSTARLLSPGIERHQLFQRDTNLRLGFRYFRSLMDYYRGNTRLALLAYNRGPVRVDNLLKAGQDPNNGYAGLVMKGIGK